MGIALVISTIIVCATIITIFHMKYGCKHDYEQINKINVYMDDDRMPAYFKYVWRCKKCGKIKTKRV